jgi:alanine racemase
MLSASRWISVEGIFSHYADSESENLNPARKQRALFLSALDGMHVPLVHMACSAASLRLPVPPTNMVRLGIGLYGLWPSEATKRHAPKGFSLRPALAWKTRVFQVKRIPAGTTVGYARTYVTKKATTLAVLPVGYADGYDRRASNKGCVVINGRRCPVIGRVSMNLTAVDCGPKGPVRPGDEVTLIGEGVTADDVAAAWGTIHYEAISRIDRAIPRKPVA